MTATEIIAEFRILGYSVGEEFFRVLASHVPETRLAAGQRLTDATDFMAWLRELAKAAENGCVRANTGDEAGTTGERTRTRIQPAKRPHHLDTCHRCGHIHQGDSECGEQLGGGRICRCELEVSA